MTQHVATELTEFSVEIIRPRGVFNAKTTLLKPSHFPSPFDDAGLDRYRFVTHVGRSLVGVQTWIEEPSVVGVRLYRVARENEEFDAAAVKAEIRRRLGLEMELTGFEAFWKRDDILRKLPDEMMGARPSSPFSLYEFLMICVFLQNTTVRRTVVMANTLAQEIGHEVLFPDGVTLRSFWSPEQMARTGEQKLRGLKLGYRARTLDRISRQFQVQSRLDSQLLKDSANDEDMLRRELLSLYGIGPASVGYIMFEWFKKINCFEHISPWELKILGQLLFKSVNIPAKKMIAFCRQRWSPFTMLAVHAIFESVFWRRSNNEELEWLDAFIRL